MSDKPATPKIALVTGASGGIGAETARVFAAKNYAVVLAARRIDRLKTLCTEIQNAQPSAELLPIEADVARDQDVTRLISQARERFGRLTTLVVNAGYGVYGSIEATPMPDFVANMETNYFGAIRCIQAALPLLRTTVAQSRQRWPASIVLVSSIVGRRAMPMTGSYSATKFALEGLAEALRVELWDDRIAVSVVNPGATRTDFGTAASGNRPGTFLSLEKGMEPGKVADAIYRASLKPRRNVYLTGAGKAAVLLQHLAPRVMDRIMLGVHRRANGK